MSGLKERENAFENKYAHDAEMQFKVEVRANKLLGLWAAELLKKTGDDAEEYAKEVIKSDFEEPGDEDVIRKVAGDLGDLSSPDEVRKQRAECLSIAKAQVIDEV